jgi:hypothetical protein
VILKPVVSQNETVTLAICPLCKGTALYYIDKYVTDDDLNSLARLISIGYKAESKPLKAAKNVGDCECNPDVLDSYEAKKPAPARQPLKPSTGNLLVLSLKSRRSS